MKNRLFLIKWCLLPFLLCTSCETKLYYYEARKSNIPYYFKKQTINGVRYLVEYSQKNGKTPENAYHIDSFLIHSSSIIDEKCTVEYCIDNSLFNNVPCNFGVSKNIRYNISHSITQETINDFDSSQYSLCLLFDDLAEINLFPKEISLKIYFTQPVFTGNGNKINFVVWAPHLDAKPPISSFIIKQEYYMFDGWNHNMNDLFAEQNYNYWDGDHYLIIDEYDDMDAFFNDEINNSPIYIH